MQYDWIQLPQRDADLYTWARRVAPLFERGPQAAFLNATSRQYYVGAGELAGVSSSGRLRDWRYARSEMRGQNSFRFREISPDRHAMVLIDLRDVANNFETKRLLSCAIATAVLLSSTANTKVTWGAFGADRSIPAIRLESVRPAKLLRGAANAMLHFGRDPFRVQLKRQQGVIRRLLACAADAHVVFVSHFLESELLRGLPILFGSSAFLVEPANDGLLNPRGVGLLGSALPAGLPGKFNPDLKQATEKIRSRRCISYPIAATGDLTNLISSQVSKRGKGRGSV